MWGPPAPALGQLWIQANSPKHPKAASPSKGLDVLSIQFYLLCCWAYPRRENDNPTIKTRAFSARQSSNSTHCSLAFSLSDDQRPCVRSPCQLWPRHKRLDFILLEWFPAVAHIKLKSLILTFKSRRLCCYLQYLHWIIYQVISCLLTTLIPVRKEQVVLVMVCGLPSKVFKTSEDHLTHLIFWSVLLLLPLCRLFGIRHKHLWNSSRHSYLRHCAGCPFWYERAYRMLLGVYMIDVRNLKIRAFM